MPGLFGIWPWPLLDKILDFLSNGNGNDKEPGEPDPPKNFSGEVKYIEDPISHVKMPYIYLQWEAPEDDGGYDIGQYTIYRATGEEEYALYYNLPDDARDICDADLKSKGVKHYYYVTSGNIKKESKASEVVELIVGDN